MDNTFAQKSIKYFTNLKVPDNLPEHLSIMNPYSSNSVKKLIIEFYNKFYNDSNKRIYILGINPGRFGGGLTGISFTDPVALRESCGIENDLSNQKELSSEFIYMVIKKFGGTDKFFSDFYLSAVYPLAILNNGKNYNYYDDRQLWNHLKPEISKSINNQK